MSVDALLFLRTEFVDARPNPLHYVFTDILVDQRESLVAFAGNLS